MRKHTLFIALATLLLAAPAFAASGPIAPAHVIVYSIDGQGVLQPTDHFIRNRELTPMTEEMLEAALAENDPGESHDDGKLAVRAFDAVGNVLYRTAVNVKLWAYHHTEQGPVREPMRDRGFILVVPREAASVTFEGWKPVHRSMFDLEEVRAQFGEGRVAAQSDVEAQATRIELPQNRLNILVLGDGYTDTTTSQQDFNSHVTQLNNALGNTSPFDRYRSFIHLSAHYTKSNTAGAAHPQCKPVAPPGSTQPPALECGYRNNDPIPPANSTRTSYLSRYCLTGTDTRLIDVDHGKVRTEIAAVITGATPDVVVVMFNDIIYGGTYTEFAMYAARHPSAGNIATHEIAHALGLHDEYVDTGQIGGVRCTDSGTPANTPACESNVTNVIAPSGQTAPDLRAIKWARWIDVSPIPFCSSADQIEPSPPVQGWQPCRNLTRADVGVYERAIHASGYYRPEFTCRMKDVAAPIHTDCTRGHPGARTAPGFCRICTEHLIRRLYAKVDPAENIREQRHLYTYDKAGNEIEPSDFASRLSAGREVTVGADLLQVNGAPGSTPVIEWKINNQPVQGPNLPPSRIYKGVSGQETIITMSVIDGTSMVRDRATTPNAPVTHPKPKNMTRTLKWRFITPGVAKAVSAGADLQSQTIEIVVPKGSQGISLKYSVTTDEPGGRTGDTWGVVVAYGGSTATALTAKEPPYKTSGKIYSSAENIIGRSLNIPVEGTGEGDVTILLTVRVQNGEDGRSEEQKFIPTTIEAEVLTQAMTSCGASCQACIDNPTAPGCPFHFMVKSASMQRTDTSDRGFVSIAVKGNGHLERGRHVSLTTTNVPDKDIQSIRFTANLMTPDGDDFGVIRTGTWTPTKADAGIEVKHKNDRFEFNVAQKGDFDDLLPQIDPARWPNAIKYRITAVATLKDGRIATSEFDVDRFDAATPIRALWWTPHSNAQKHKWSTANLHRWLTKSGDAFHLVDRIADEHAQYDTLRGHELVNKFTEVPFYPGAGVWSNSFTVALPYRRFRENVADLAFDEKWKSDEALRSQIAQWITDTRSHVQGILCLDGVALVVLGDGGACGDRPDDQLPDGWMRDLLETGTITSRGEMVVDLTALVGSARWDPPCRRQLAYNCQQNLFPDIEIDRCKLGETPPPCTSGRPPGTGKNTRITSEPAPHTVIDDGQSATLEVGAEGTDLRYRWYAGPVGDFVGSTPVPGDDYKIEVSPSETQTYWVYVWGAYGNDTSDAALVEVRGTGGPCVSPKITEQPPKEVFIGQGTFQFLAVRAEGTNLRYQWLYKWWTDDEYEPIANATEKTHLAGTPGKYQVRVYNSCGYVYSEEAFVYNGSSCVGPVIFSQSHDATVTRGDSIDLGVYAGGKEPLSYIWYEHTPTGYPTPIGYDDGITITPTVDGTDYFVSVINECAAISSERIKIYVCDPPKIETQPVAPVFTAFGQARFIEVIATGTRLKYRWTQSGANLPDDGPKILIGAPSARTYYTVYITNECGDETSETIAVDPPCFPPDVTVTTQPQDGSVVAGDEITFTAVGTGTPLLEYQWQARIPPAADFTDVGGATGTLFKTNPEVDDSAYRVVVTNGCGTVPSAPIVVDVRPRCFVPRIATHPAGTTIDHGGEAELTVAATGSDPLSYAWQRLADGVWVAAGGGSSIKVRPDVGEHKYRAYVSNACGEVYSNEAVITVKAPPCDPPFITRQPVAPVFTAIGQTDLIRVEATGTDLHYEWFAAGANVPNSDTPELRISAPTFATQYRVRITNACGSVPSESVTVDPPCAPATITADPQGGTIESGQSIPLTAAADGTPQILFQWLVKEPGDAAYRDIDGATEASYPASPTVDGTSYRVRVTNDCGNDVSAEAVVRVTQPCVPVRITSQPGSVTITEGAGTTLSVIAEGTAPIGYRWYTLVDGMWVAVPGGTSSSLPVAPPVGQTSYRVVVSNACYELSSQTAVVTVTPPACEAPRITRQPVAPVFTAIGQTEWIRVEATGTDLHYEWFASGANVPNSDAPEIRIPAPIATTYYRVRVTGACGNLLSEAAEVEPPCQAVQIDEPPASTTIEIDHSATLSVQASGSGTLTYQWYIAGGGAIAGETGSSITVSPSTTTSYYVVVGNACGSRPSSAATVTVLCPLPTVNTPPQSRTIESGQPVTLTVAATGVRTLSYQWRRQVDGVVTSIPDATGTSITVSPSTTTSYWADVTNTCGTTSSAVAIITVVPCAVPSITQQPQGVSIQSGQQATLTAAGSGSGALSYRWFTSDGSPVPNGTGNSLVVSPASTTSYYCEISNDCGARRTDTVTVTVVTCTVPSITVQPVDSTVQRDQEAILAVAATGTAPLSYQWYGRDPAVGDYELIPGATSSVLGVTLQTTHDYYVVVGNACGTVASVPARVTVIQPPQCTAPSITQHPQGGTIARDTVVRMDVAATGTELRYQWYEKAPSYSMPWSLINGLDTTWITAQPIESGTYYFVEVWNDCGRVKSDDAVWTITP